MSRCAAPRPLPRLAAVGFEPASQADHTDRRHGPPTDWQAIAALSRDLAALHPTLGAISALAAALREAEGPAAGLGVLAFADPKRCATHRPWWAVRADLRNRSGDQAGAAVAHNRAIALSSDPAIRAFLSRRLADCTAAR